jgi:ABC-type lipoprotein release transport system permease subunit
MAVMLSAVMSSMQQGQYDQMIDNTVGSFSGHIQIQHPEYHDEATLNHTFTVDSSLIQKVDALDDIKTAIPRLETYSLAAGREKSRAVMVLGIDVEKEKYLSKPDSKIIAGSYFNSNSDRSVLISQGLAAFLEIQVNDTLILIGQGFRGMSATGGYPVQGIVRFGLPDMNKRMVYLPIETAGNYLATQNRLTSIALLLEDPRKTEIVAESLSSELSSNEQPLAVLSWQTLMPELVQAIQADRGSAYILLLILYIVVGFGIMGTVLMMTAERSYEFGVMLAIGTSRIKMALMIVTEMLFMSLLGVIMGILVSQPIIWYYHLNPMHFTGQAAQAIEEYGMEPFVRFSTDVEISIIQALIVLVITMIISLYPIIHMYKLKPVSAMRR